MVLSTFSHSSFLHLAANMFVLNSFSSIAVSGLGKEQFLALYLTSGVISSFVSYFYKAAFRMPGFSLGAVSNFIHSFTQVICIRESLKTIST